MENPINSNMYNSLIIPKGLLVFTSEKYPKVYIFGTTHTVVKKEITDFIDKLKIDTVVLEDPMPFCYLADQMQKIAETYYLNLILQKQSNSKKYHKLANQIVEEIMFIPDNTVFNIELLKRGFDALSILNTNSNSTKNIAVNSDFLSSFDALSISNKNSEFKIISADSTKNIAIKRENSLHDRVKLLHENKFDEKAKKMALQSADEYIANKYDQSFFSQVVQYSNNPFYNLKWDALEETNKDWAKNLVDNVFPTNKNIVMFCGSVHLNQFLENSLVSILDRDYGIKFNCVNAMGSFKHCLLDIRMQKNIGNEYFKNKDFKKALNIYRLVFKKYKSHSLCKCNEFNREYLGVLGNIISVYYRDNLGKLRKYVKLAEKLVVYMNIDPLSISLGKKLELANKKL
jgi:tetratricopeptide (TPR) repeat protein